LSGEGFLVRSGQPGMFGALLDEYARAAEDLCRTVEALSEDRFLQERDSLDPETASLQAVCSHVAGSAWSYAEYIRAARGLPPVPRPYPYVKDAVAAPAALRPLLTLALRHTETTVDGCPTTLGWNPFDSRSAGGRSTTPRCSWSTRSSTSCVTAGRSSAGKTS